MQVLEHLLSNQGYIESLLTGGKRVFFHTCTYFSTQGWVQHCGMKLVSDIVHSSGEFGTWLSCLELDMSRQSIDFRFTQLVQQLIHLLWL